MSAKNDPVDPCEIVSTRQFDAPREFVFAAMADPQRFARWWGPSGFTTTVHEFDLRPGAVLKYTMHGPDGANYYNESQVVEATRPVRIVLDHLEPMHRFRMTQQFGEVGGKTTVTWRMRFESAEECGRVREFIIPANEQNFDRLAAELASMSDANVSTPDREIVITRMINAPRELVFDAYTIPEHVSEWWGPNGFTLTHERMDVRPGGVWKFVMHGPDGTDYPNKIEYQEVVRPERIAFVHGGGKPGDKSVQFRSLITFVDHGAKTEVTMRSIFPTAEDRDRVVRDYNAIEGGKQTLARLEQFVTKGSAP